MLRSIGKQTGESVESVLGTKTKATVGIRLVWETSWQVCNFKDAVQNAKLQW